MVLILPLVILATAATARAEDKVTALESAAKAAAISAESADIALQDAARDESVAAAEKEKLASLEAAVASASAKQIEKESAAKAQAVMAEVVNTEAAKAEAAKIESVTSPVQSAARVMGLSIVEKVQLAASDEASAVFQKETLPSITKLINTSLGETSKFVDATKFALDPAKLRMSVESTARVYFVGEGAGYLNTLGFNTIASDASAPKAGLDESAQLIFPNASSTVSTYNPGVKAVRTASAPLLPGDFVDLGAFKAGSMLDFFLIANGAGGGKSIWTASAARNSDGLNHVVSFALPGSPYLIMAFEDLLGGGDRDYNDVVFAVDIGAINVERLLSTPEPAAWASVLALGGVAFLWRRRLAAGSSSSV